MTDFKKLAAFLDSFDKHSSGYDVACYIKAKIANDLQDRETVNNGEEEDLEDNDITMSTPDQQASSNTEGEVMSGAFQELDVQNKLKEEKEEIKLPDNDPNHNNKPEDLATEQSFGNNIFNQKNASLFSVLQNKIKK